MMGSLMLSAHAGAQQSIGHELDETSLLQISRGGRTRSVEESKQAGMFSKGIDYYWSQRGRDLMKSSSTSHTAPSNFSAGPSWTWANELDEQVRHSPLIDDTMHIYVTTATRIRKFNSNGTVVWTWRNNPDDGKMVSCPALYEGSVFAVSRTNAGSITMHSIDMAHGTVNWKRSVLHQQWQDASSIFVHNNTMMVALREDHPLSKKERNRLVYEDADGGNNMVYAVNSSDGSHLWQYPVDEILWNWSPTSPGDGTLLFASSCGGVHRITFSGEQIWRKGPDPRPDVFCSSGGGALGPNNVFYVEYNDDLPGTNLTAKHGAHIKAYHVSNGSLLWSHSFGVSESGMQYPAVGNLGRDGPLALIVALGQPPLPPSPMNKLLNPMPETYRHRNAVVAMNAISGDVLWRFDEDPWRGASGAGEVDLFEERVARAKLDERSDWFCSPDPQGIPLIAGDGIVYTSSGLSGDLRAMKDIDGDGMIGATEVSTFSTHRCFLNSPSLAPGMLVAAPCWGPMYVFKEDKI